VENFELDKNGILVVNQGGDQIFDKLKDALNQTPLKITIGKVVYRKSASGK
jgi:rRNA-processing protein FCF1